MRNIIETDKLGNHTVSPYRFKVLGGETNILETSEVKNADEKNDVIEIQKNIEQPIQEPLQPEPSTVEQKPQDQFIEALLKKSDELSSNIVKLQMQIEKQESEFEKRLQNELAKESESSYEKGYKQAKSELEDSFKKNQDLYLNSIKQLDDEIKNNNQHLKKLEDELSYTAIDVAKEVILKEVTHNSSQIALTLSKALMEELKEAKNVELKVNPKDSEALNALYSDIEHVKVTSDNAIMPGGVIVLSDVGNLDGNLSTRIEKVKNLIQSDE